MKTSKKIILTIIFLIIFVFIVLEILFNGFLVSWDLLITSFIPSIQNNFFISIAKSIDLIFDTKSLIVVSFVLAFILWIKKYKKNAVFFLYTMLSGGLAIYIVKEVFQRARPLNSILQDSGFSFPSGHTAISAIFFGLLIYLAFKNKKSEKIKTTTFLISGFLILLIGFSRIYLNTHWFSDVLGGFALGLFILMLCIVIKENIIEK